MNNSAGERETERQRQTDKQTDRQKVESLRGIPVDRRRKNTSNVVEASSSVAQEKTHFPRDPIKIMI